MAPPSGYRGSLWIQLIVERVGEHSRRTFAMCAATQPFKPRATSRASPDFSCTFAFLACFPPSSRGAASWEARAETSAKGGRNLNPACAETVAEAGGFPLGDSCDRRAIKKQSASRSSHQDHPDFVTAHNTRICCCKDLYFFSIHDLVIFRCTEISNFLVRFST